MTVQHSLCNPKIVLDILVEICDTYSVATAAADKPDPPVPLEEFDPDDMLVTRKPVNKKPGQLDKRRLEDFEKRPSYKSFNIPRSTQPSE